MVVRRSSEKESLRFLKRRESQAQPRQKSRVRMSVVKEKDRREETRIPAASDNAKKRKGKGISL
jgi:hypothetical protein